MARALVAQRFFDFLETTSIERFGAFGCDSGNDDDYCCESSHLGVGQVVSVAEPNLDDEIRCSTTHRK